MEKYNSEFFFNNLIFTLIILAASFLQISLNFLSIFVISQPYILAIVLFLTLRRVDYEVSSILIILYGLLYDLITLNLSISNKIQKKYGEWFLFSFSYIIGLLIVKLIFVIVNFKFPDIYAISFNVGTTLLLFPVILFLIDIPKIVFKVFISK